MARRPYRLRKRAETSAATRQRIVEATLGLHDEQGITSTSLRNVAARAGVAPATVLHHFPQMDDLIEACGELSDKLAPMPTEAVLTLGRNRAERIRLLVLALFGWWEQLGPGWDHLQVDRRRLPQVDTWLRHVADRHRNLVAVALGPAEPSDVSVVTALTTQGVWRSLHDAGHSTPHAAAQVARRINAAVGGPSLPRGDPTQGVH